MTEEGMTEYNHFAISNELMDLGTDSQWLLTSHKKIKPDSTYHLTEVC